jgi:hypothetical protein
LDRLAEGGSATDESDNDSCPYLLGLWNVHPRHKGPDGPVSGHPRVSKYAAPAINGAGAAEATGDNSRQFKLIRRVREQHCGRDMEGGSGGGREGGREGGRLTSG